MRSPVLLETERYGAMEPTSFLTIDQTNPLMAAADREMAKYLPDENERTSLYSWCARLVDHFSEMNEGFIEKILKKKLGYTTKKEIEAAENVVREALHYSLHVHAVVEGFNEELACSFFSFLFRVTTGELDAKLEIQPYLYLVSQLELERWERSKSRTVEIAGKEAKEYARSQQERDS